MESSSQRPGKTLAARRPVESLIHVIRGQKVMLDSDLAELYGVPTRTLNQAVRRNLGRFPEDFMFELSLKEAAELKSKTTMIKGDNMRSQIVIASKRNIRYQPLAFTEPGVAMLSSVLRSERAVHMNILIMRAFIRMRELAAANKDIATRLEKLERGHDRTASVIEVLVEDIDRLARELKEMKALPPVKKRRIGFILDDD